MAHRDPGVLPAIRELRERYPLRADEPSRIGDVVRTGEPSLIQASEEWLQSIAADPEHLELLRELEMGSVLAAPMSAGGTVLGALVFVNQRGSREFDAHDLAIATEVAGRAGLAIESRAARG